MRRWWWVVTILLAGCAAKTAPSNGRKMIILGVDGMDPAFLERHWDSLPNLRKLASQGDFKRLATSIPPQSPVAWSSVITGMDPGGHGIFDFIHRNPATRMPVSSMAEAKPPERVFRIGKWAIPLEGGALRSLRSGQAFWHTLTERGVRATVVRMPANFPPEECEAESLAGMGTPDLEGSFGTFTFFTNDPAERRTTVSGGRIVAVDLKNGEAKLTVRGPENSLRTDHPVATVEIAAFVDPREAAVRFDTAEERVVLRQGEWSDWLHLRFPLIEGVKDAAGMVRIYVQQVHPYLRVYVSPVNLDPASPELPISTPPSFSQTLAKAVGPYYTQGIAEEASAFRAGIFNKDEYLVQSHKILEDSLKLFRHELQRFSDGLLFYYFSSVDQNAHMLWGRYEADLLEVYKAVDGAIGEAMAKAGSDIPLLVISDHGFARFDRAVHLNAWLRKEGFLTLREGAKPGDEELFVHVDWSKTRAYALGLNSIYLNQEFREPDGIVTLTEREAVLEEISKRLLEFRDTGSNERVVSKLFYPGTDFQGQNTKHAPDIFVGYKAGYRASWQTALGAVPEQLLEDNTAAWIGDHCMNPAEVPGVLLSNRKVRNPQPQLYDIPATVLGYFGIERTSGMIGNSVF